MAEGPGSSDLENDIAAMKAENAAVREQLRKMEEQQKTLLELVDAFAADGLTAGHGADAQSAGQPIGPSPTNVRCSTGNECRGEYSAAGDRSSEILPHRRHPLPKQSAIATSVTRMELLFGKLPTTLRCRSC